MNAVIATESLVEMYDAAFLDGGFTVFVGGAPMNRYAVSASSEQTTVAADAPFAEFAGAVESAYSAHPGASAIGGWIHEGRIYVDPVETYDSRATAEEYGRNRGQVAIYDLRDNQEVML